MESIGSPLLWIGFTIFILVMLALDLGVFNRKAHEIKTKEALFWSILWIVLALAFNAAIYFWFGKARALEYLTGYLIERALSIDNLFVFIVLFNYFAVPKEYHHRVLFWGIIGVLITRAIFIFAGAALIQSFHWVIYVLGAFLVFTGIKLLSQRDKEIQPERNVILKVFRKIVPAVTEYRGARFCVKEGGKYFATPLLMVLVIVEATDVVFAVDSIPAIFAITTDPFIVFTSNIFAILGLRAFYFLMAGIMDKFVYLKIGLALVLAFVGAKMLFSDIYHIDIGISLGVIAVLIGGSIAISLLQSNKVHEK